MPTVYVPTLVTEVVDLGPSPIANPSTLILEVNGVVYGDQCDIFSTSDYNRQLFPSYESSTGHIKLVCVTLAHNANAPAFSATNVKVHVIV